MRNGKTSKGDAIIIDHLNVKSPEYQKIKLHYERKRSLGAGLESLRHCLHLLYGDDWIDNATQHDELEDLLDTVLIEHRYDIEAAIDSYGRTVAPKYTDAICTCGYVMPFCTCRLGMGVCP